MCLLAAPQLGCAQPPALAEPIGALDMACCFIGLLAWFSRDRLPLLREVAGGGRHMGRHDEQQGFDMKTFWLSVPYPFCSRQTKPFEPGVSPVNACLL
jgi:hypothetical protein